MSTSAETFDVVVIGGGPGGSACATLIAQQGHRVLLLERDKLPIYKIGESLLPATVHGICAILGVTEELKAANFVRKLGGTFRWGRNKEPWTFSFASSPRFPGPSSFAYQVERIKFDAILLNNARRKGVDVRERHRAMEPLIDETGRVAGVRVANDQGDRLDIRARYVVDASGHGSTLARHVSERIYSEFFRNVAIFGYFLNGGRLPAPNSGNIYSVAFERGWIWYIPLSDTLTSVGVVIGQEHASTTLKQDREEALRSLIAECPQVRNLLQGARRATDAPYDEIRIRKDFSYCHTAFWRPGLVLVGDAACFIDPVFSSGVHLATYSALLAARSVNTFLANRLTETEVFAEFQKRYLREYGFFHDFLVAFYDLDQELDQYYWAARKALGADVSGREAFIRLVGGGAGTDHVLVAPGGGGVATASALSEQLFPVAQAQGVDDMHLASEARRDISPLTTAREQFMTALTTESVQMQAQARQIRYSQTPLFTDGLVPSADGLQWEPRHRR